MAPEPRRRLPVSGQPHPDRRGRPPVRLHLRPHPLLPRPQHINSPAPSLVEATLAPPNPAPTIAASATARTLLARLIAEGSAVPLNLLGAPSTTPDAPDFVASAATFPYIFTLRGDKAWKQPPATSGATKVTPLALNTYTLIVENGRLQRL